MLSRLKIYDTYHIEFMRNEPIYDWKFLPKKKIN